MVEVEDEPGVHRDLPRLVTIGSQLDRPPLAAGDLHRPVPPQVALVREAVGLPALIAAPFTVTGRACGHPRCVLHVLPDSPDLRAGAHRPASTRAACTRSAEANSRASFGLNTYLSIRMSPSRQTSSSSLSTASTISPSSSASTVCSSPRAQALSTMARSTATAAMTGDSMTSAAAVVVRTSGPIPTR